MANYEQQASEWFATRGVNLNCTQCGTNRFKVGEELIPLVSTDSEGNITSGTGYWALPVACNNCGHILMFNAAQMGLTPEQYR